MASALYGTVIGSFVGSWPTDRFGRKPILLGMFGFIIWLGLVAWAFFMAHYSIVPVCLFGFIAAHAVGQGVVIWVFTVEVFPNCHRAEGQTLGCFTN